MKRLSAALLFAASSAAAALSVPLNPLPFDTLSLGGGFYQVYADAGVKVVAYSPTALNIAQQPGQASDTLLDLDWLPSDTQQPAPGHYVTSIGGVTYTIQSDHPLGILPPRQPGLIREDRGKPLSTFPGLPSDITGSLNIVETPGSVIFSYSLINVGNRTYTLDADDLMIRQSGQGVAARLERRNGNLTPGLLEPGKGEIGRITVPKVSSAPLILTWILRSGQTPYTLTRQYDLKP